MGTIPRDWIELRTRDEFLHYANTDNGVIVISDSANGIKAHHPRCVYISVEHFDQKVSDNGNANGAYFWAPDRESAVAGGATPCRSPQDPI